MVKTKISNKIKITKIRQIGKLRAARNSKFNVHETTQCRRFPIKEVSEEWLEEIPSMFGGNIHYLFGPSSSQGPNLSLLHNSMKWNMMKTSLFTWSRRPKITGFT